MGRIWLGNFLLAVLLIFGLWCANYTERTMAPIAGELEQAAQALRAGQVRGGIERAEQAQGKWEKAWHSTAALSDHTPMDEIDGLFAQLSGYQTEPAHYAACCDRIAQLIYAMAEAHSPTWWNLL